MNQNELQQVLAELAADRVALIQRHEAAARTVSHYDFNNTYQYVVNREETHLTWLQSALAELRAPVPPAGTALPAPRAQPPGKKVDAASDRSVIEDDVRYLRSFIERWRPRIETLSSARHRTMLNVILGESAEHQQLFEQAAAGFEDLLGRRTGGVARVGGVLPTRWIE